MTSEQLLEFQAFATAQHAAVNHFYDDTFNLPYQFHLKLVVNTGKRFEHLIEHFQEDALTGFFWDVFKHTIDDAHPLLRVRLNNELTNNVYAALWGHDLIEDARVSYNDCLDHSNKYVCELIYALTNSKGRNRKERQNEAYYEGLKAVPGAVFCKLCDRIANVEYGKLMQSRQLNTYRRENDEFTEKLYDSSLEEMFTHLNDLLK